MYLLMPPTPAQQPRPIIHPRPLIRHPGISTILPAKPKYPITNPNQPRHYGNTFKFWVVGNTRCGLMKSFRQVLGIDISGYHSQVVDVASNSLILPPPHRPHLLNLNPPTRVRNAWCPSPLLRDVGRIANATSPLKIPAPPLPFEEGWAARPFALDGVIGGDGEWEIGGDGEREIGGDSGIGGPVKCVTKTTHDENRGLFSSFSVPVRL
jgi:hypothetical protein